MELNTYQEKAMTTCLPQSKNLAYMLSNLVGEVGEFAGKVAKYIRKEKHPQLSEICDVHDVNRMVVESIAFSIAGGREEELKKEAGDVLWQLQGLCSYFGWSLEEIAQMNLDKLASRKERDVIDGDGDNR